jgi:hypothetical protein
MAKIPEITESKSEKFTEWIKKDSRNLLKTMGVAAVIFILLLTPSWLELGMVNPYMQGRAQEYKWQPAILPSIEYTQWAYGVNDIQRTNISAITFSGKEILQTSRLFNNRAAKLNILTSALQHPVFASNFIKQSLLRVHFQ